MGRGLQEFGHGDGSPARETPRVKFIGKAEARGGEEARKEELTCPPL
jgi:hypothetical protein